MIYQLALFGHPVKHSLSPQIHQAFARQFKLEIHYDLIDVTTENLTHRVREFFTRGGHGANITVPHKQDIMNVADQLTERAKQAAAVNTLFLNDHQLWGDNTDGDGLLNDLTEKNIPTNNQRILIIGAGGAVQGILPSLLKSQPGAIYIHNRTQHKAQALAATSPHCHALIDNENYRPFDLIINGTSLGHRSQSPDFKPDWISPKTIAYDLSYGPAAEPFLTQAKSLGVQQTHDGFGMLQQQAALGFQLWFGKKPCLD